MAPQSQQGENEAICLKEDIEYLQQELDAAKARLGQLEAVKSV
jgi:hypothetical protein